VILIKRFFLCSIVIIGLFVALFSTYAAEIESVIPAYSPGYVSVENVSGIWDALRVSPVWSGILSSGNLDYAIAQMEEQFGVELQTLMGAFGRRVAFVQTNIFPDPDGMAKSAVIIDVEDLEGATEVVQRMQQSLNSKEEIEVRPDAGTYRGVPFGAIRHRGEQLPFRYTFLGNLFVFALGQDSFEALADVYLGEEPSLIYDPKFNRTCADISGENEIFAYANMELLWPFMQATWDPDMKQIMQILGAYEIKSIAYTANLLSPTREQEMYVFTGAIGGFPLTSMFMGDQPLSSPHLIPASGSHTFFAMHLGDPMVVWEMVTNSVRNVMGEREYGDMQSSISEFEWETGLSLNSDILSSLTGEVGFSMPLAAIIGITAGGPTAMFRGGFMMFCGVADREKCATAIEKIFSAASIQTQQKEYKGVKIHEIFALSSMEFPVGYMFAGDLLIFGNFKRLEAIINEEPPLVVSEAFFSINSRLPWQPGLIWYMDLKSAVEMLWQLGLLNQPEEYIERLKALGSVGGGMSQDGEGLRVSWSGTLGTSWLETIGEIAALLNGISR